MPPMDKMVHVPQITCTGDACHQANNRGPKSTLEQTASITPPAEPACIQGTEPDYFLPVYGVPFMGMSTAFWVTVNRHLSKSRRYVMTSGVSRLLPTMNSTAMTQRTMCHRKASPHTFSMVKGADCKMIHAGHSALLSRSSSQRWWFSAHRERRVWMDTGAQRNRGAVTATPSTGVFHSLLDTVVGGVV